MATGLWHVGVALTVSDSEREALAAGGITVPNRELSGPEAHQLLNRVRYLARKVHGDVGIDNWPAPLGDVARFLAEHEAILDASRFV